jgi:pimeloyl-ACP methyl ester carboxylesterase
VTIFVRSADGRQLAVRVSGNPTGHPVVYLHGTPGSRVGPLPLMRVLYELGVRLISFDRPGYGGSDRRPGRRVADVAQDVEAIADQLGLDPFAVVGRSGGGPHALACAALLPGRVTRAGALVSLAPWEAEGLDWFAGMSESNVREFTAARSEPELLTTTLAQVAGRVQADPTSLVPTLGPEMPEADRRVVADDDNLAFCMPWGFEVSDIHVPVLLWHGENDVFSPAAHTRWLAERIPGAESWVGPDAAQFGALEVLPDVLSWLIRPN